MIIIKLTLKNNCEMVFLSKISVKISVELNPSDSVIPALPHKFINYYVRYRMCAYPLKESWLLRS